MIWFPMQFTNLTEIKSHFSQSTTWACPQLKDENKKVLKKIQSQ